MYVTVLTKILVKLCKSGIFLMILPLNQLRRHGGFHERDFQEHIESPEISKKERKHSEMQEELYDRVKAVSF